MRIKTLNESLEDGFSVRMYQRVFDDVVSKQSGDVQKLILTKTSQGAYLTIECQYADQDGWYGDAGYYITEMNLHFREDSGVNLYKKIDLSYVSDNELEFSQVVSAYATTFDSWANRMKNNIVNQGVFRLVKPDEGYLERDFVKSCFRALDKVRF